MFPTIPRPLLSLLTALAFVQALAARDSIVVFNEIHYQPAGDNDALEWVELYNENAANVDISGWRIDGGIQFDIPEGTVIEGGQYLVIAKDPAALQAETGFADAFGPFAGRLANSGETVRLYNNNGAAKTLPGSGGTPTGPTADKIWSVDIQGDGAGGAFGQQNPPLDKSGLESNSGLGAVWNHFTVQGFNNADSETNPSMPLVDSAGAASPVSLSITGTVIGWSESGNALTSDYLFVNAGGADAVISWELSGLVAGKAHTIWFYGGSGRNIRITVDSDGDGSLANNTAQDASSAGLEVTGIVADASGKVIGSAARGTSSEGDWSGLQIFQEPEIEEPPAAVPNASLEGRRVMDAVDYRDTGRWPVAPDGSGATLAKRDPDGGSARAVNWSSSIVVNGTPGGPNFVSGGGGGESIDFGADSSGNNQTGTAVALTATAGNGGFEGEAASFNGATGYLSVPVSLNHTTNPRMSFGAWVKPNTSSASHAIIAHDDGGWDRTISIGSGAGASVGWSAFAGGHQFPGTGVPVSTSTWTFIAGVFDQAAGSMTVYVDADASTNGDAVQAFTDNATVFGTSALPTNIGRLPTNIWHFSGLIDNAFFVSDALSSAQIAALRNGGSAAVHALGNDLLAFYEFDTPASVGGGGPVNPDALPKIAINELAASDAPAFEVELHNFGTDSVALGGMVLASSDPLTADFVIPAQSLAGGAFVAFDQAALGFGAADGDRVFLYLPGKGSVIDAGRVDNALKGRLPDGTGRWANPDSATFGAANSFDIEDAIVINEILYHAYPDRGSPATPPTFSSTVHLPLGATWRYNQNASGAGLPAGWQSAVHPVDNVDWFEGAALMGLETNPGALPDAIRTPLTRNSTQITYYFETEFTFSGDPAAGQFSLNHVIDDGAIFYLNGVEVGRFNMPTGAVTPATLAAPGVSDAGTVSLSIPTGNLIVGSNRLSVEVHQTTSTSSDVVFGVEVLTRVEETPLIPGTPYSNNPEEWIELFNRGGTSVDLSGWKLNDGVSFDFPPGTTMAPGSFLVIAEDEAALRAKYPAISIVGQFSGGLSNAGERLVLEDALGNPADELRYYDWGRWHAAADGGGSSLELRDSDADNSVAEAWAPSDETGGSPWQTYSYRGTAANDGVGNNVFHEFLLGLLDAGELLLDDVSVIENPGGAALQFIQNGDFEGDAAGAVPDKWRCIGTHGSHGRTVVVVDPDDAGNKCLHVIATGPTGDKHNKIETTFANAERVQIGAEYEITFRAKWLTGTNQVNTRLYFNYLQRTTHIDVPTQWGTPGAANSVLEANIGPTYTGFAHSPVVPPSGAPVTVSVAPSDPDGVSAMTLFYRVNATSAFSSVAMTANPDGTWSGTVPGQGASAVVQFYVEGQDGAGATSTFPADGPDSRALYRVQDGAAALGLKHNFRIIMRSPEESFLFLNTNRMSNDRQGATVLYDEETVFYDVAVRLKASAFGRYAGGHFGFNVQFEPDQLFRGVHRTVAIERAPDPKEILAKHLLNRAGGTVATFYDDPARVIGPGGSTGNCLLSMARYTATFWDGLYGGAAGDGTLYNHELLYNPNGPLGEALKINNPYNHTNGRYDIEDRGDDKEPYRFGFQIRSNRSRDNYQPMIELGKAFELSGQALQDAVEQVIDVDQWMRMYAMMALNGNDDVYGRIWEHNFRYYHRATDGKLVALPWDLDRAFQLGTSSSLIPTRNNLMKLFTTVPAFRRQMDAHLLDIIETTYNPEYLGEWYAHLSSLTGASNQIGYVTARMNYALSQLPTEIPFEITTNGGADFSVKASSTPLAGRAWVDVHSVELNGNPVAITWTGSDTWQINAALSVGPNVITLTARNRQGIQKGSDTITITNTSLIDLASAANTVISEIHYHPADPSQAEIDADFDDADEFEFIELTNISDNAIDLTGVAFTEGISFAFPGGTQLPAGESIVVVSNLAAFAMRYPAVAPGQIAGEYPDQLNNGGEQLRLEAADTSPIRDFDYDDDPSWPTAPDGGGWSLVLIAPDTNPDHADPANWRPSVDVGGTPGAPAVTEPLAGDPEADDDADGLSALAEHALGTSDSVPGTSPVALSVEGDGSAALTFTRNLAADDVRIVPQSSDDLETWSTEGMMLESQIHNADETVSETWTRTPAAASRLFLRLLIELR